MDKSILRSPADIPTITEKTRERQGSPLARDCGSVCKLEMEASSTTSGIVQLSSRRAPMIRLVPPCIPRCRSDLSDVQGGLARWQLLPRRIGTSPAWGC